MIHIIYSEEKDRKMVKTMLVILNFQFLKYKKEKTVRLKGIIPIIPVLGRRNSISN